MALLLTIISLVFASLAVKRVAHADIFFALSILCWVGYFIFR